jgi:crotonobetainyl-CoA:carnitine CoA-transferase CaiB-like acyl-CoA transferase
LDLAPTAAEQTSDADPARIGAKPALPHPPSHGGDGRCASREFSPVGAGEARHRLSTTQTINPRLVYCGLSGYGDSGPLSEKGGFDQVLQCLSGIAVFQGAAAGTPQVVLGSVLDYFTSALLAYGVAAALYHRERSGQGQYLSLSLLRSALTIQAGRFVWAESESRDVVRDSGTGGLTGIHPTREGWLYISVHSNHFFAALCELIGRPDLARDPRCATMRSRADHTAELVSEVRSALATRTNGKSSSASACRARRCARSRT